MNKLLFRLFLGLVMLLILQINTNLMAQTWSAYQGCPPTFTDLNATYLKKCYTTSYIYTDWYNINTYTTGTLSGTHTLINTHGDDVNAFYTVGGQTYYLQKLPIIDGDTLTEVVRLNQPIPPASSGFYSAGSVYKFIPDSLQNMIHVYFAFVLQLPHADYFNNPIFQIRLTDSLGNLLNNERFLVNTGFSNNVYYPNPNQSDNISWHLCGSGYGTTIWVDWMYSTFDLRNFVGQEVRLEIVASGCAYSGHYGYAYYASKSVNSNLIVDNCNANQDIMVTAPKGFTNYCWFDATGTQLSEGSRYYTSAYDTSFTYILCKMVTATGDTITVDKQIHYYALNAHANFELMMNQCDYKVQFSGNGTIRRIDENGSNTLPVTNCMWDFGDGSPVVYHDTMPLHTYADSGWKQVKYIIYDPENFCSDTAIIPVYISAAAIAESVVYDTVSMFHAGIPLIYNENNTFYTPGNYTIYLPGDASNGCDSTIYVTVILANGIQNDSDMDEIILYPNPVSDILYLQFPDRQIESLTVFDINGKAYVLTTTLDKTGGEIDFSGVSSGVYFVKIIDSAQQVGFYKVIKK